MFNQCDEVAIVKNCLTTISSFVLKFVYSTSAQKYCIVPEHSLHREHLRKPTPPVIRIARTEVNLTRNIFDFNVSQSLVIVEVECARWL
uniref:Uncharacterized protein n=1 Tax=Ciona savignyi TaxID=51511 RepID=H2YV17_CIOSA